jgi:hypothetical protein
MENVTSLDSDVGHHCSFDLEEERMNDLIEANWPKISQWIIEAQRPRLVVDNTITPKLDISNELTRLQAGDFIRGMFGTTTADPVHICALANEKGDNKFPFRKIETRDCDEIDSFVKLRDEPGRAVYYCVSTLKDEDKPRNKANVSEIGFLFADIDFKDIADTRADVERKLANLKYPPSVTIFSGHGIHAYWKLTESVNQCR